MNRYMMIRRLRGPAYLLLIGVMALLWQADILSLGQSWPLLLILAGLLLLAERAALAMDGPGVYQAPPAMPGQPPYPGAAYGSYAPQPAPFVPQPPADPGTAMVPAPTQALVKDQDGGQI
jgi:hypothetical protein